MTPADEAHLESLLRRGMVAGPCLELGAGLPDHNSRKQLAAHGIEYVATDLEGDVDVAADFTVPRESLVRRFRDAGFDSFASVLVFNVLEHTFDPVTILDNIFALLRPGGTCVALTPTVWPIHSYPIDCWRILPDFYIQYAERRGHELVPGTLEYVGVGPVELDDQGAATLPPPGRTPRHHLYSRIVHKLFNTTGRGMWMPSHVATAAVIRAGSTPSS